MAKNSYGPGIERGPKNSEDLASVVKDYVKSYMKPFKDGDIAKGEEDFSQSHWSLWRN